MRITATVLATIMLMLLLSSCGQQEMADDGRMKPFDEDRFFKDGSSARPLVPGTVARGHLKDRSVFYTGLEQGRYASQSPVAVNRDVLKRGQEQFNIYCAVCHSRTGDGDGMIVQRGFTPPPSFHTERLRKAPAGYMFSVISNGTAKMPSYSDVLEETDRWAIIEYVQTLQRSRNTELKDAPAGIRHELNLQQDEEPVFDRTSQSSHSDGTKEKKDDSL